MDNTNDNSTSASTKSDASAALAKDAFVPQHISNKDMAQMATQVADSIRKDFNAKLGPENPLHEVFQKAYDSHQLQQLTSQATENIWHGDPVLHLDLEVKQEPDTNLSHDNERVELIRTHTGEELSHEDFSTQTNWQWNDNPIDKQLAAEPQTDQSTAGMVHRESHAQDLWDKELNTVYGELMAKLSPSAKNDLKADEQNWLKFRDSEFKFNGDVAATTHGTMYIPMFAYNETEVIKQRVLQLHNRLGLLNQD